MASKYDEERKKLGINVGSSKVTSTVGDPSSKYYRERLILFDPVARENESKARAANVSAREQREREQFMRGAEELGRAYSIQKREQREREQFERSAQEQQNKYQEQIKKQNRTFWEKALDNAKSAGKKAWNVAKQIDDQVEAFQNAGANVLTFGLHNRLLNHLGYEDQLENEEKLIGGQIGKLTGEAVAMAGAYGLASRGLKPVTSSLPQLADKAVMPVASRLSPTAGAATRMAAQTAAKGAAMGTVGAAAGGLYQTAVEAGEAAFGVNDQTFKERARDVAEMAALGAILDPALEGYAGVIGGLIKGSPAQQAANQELRNFIQRVENTPSPTAHPSQRMVEYLDEPIARPTLYDEPTRARVERRPSLDQVLNEIKPLVDERMTPPLENPDQLARWVRQYGGLNDVSLNEIRRLPYDDLVQMADEVRRGMNVYDIARQVANERGYNLDRLLRGQRNITPDSLQRGRETLRMREVAGIPLVRRTVQRADEAIQTVPSVQAIQTAEQASAQPVKQGWFERLFGTQPLGIVARTFRGGRNPLTTEGQIVDEPLKRTARGVMGATRAAARNAYQNFVDMYSPIKSISREAYEASIDANRANQIANVIVTDKFVNPQGQVLGEGLQGIVRKVGRGNYNAFTDYLIARHALTRMKRGERVYDPKLGMTPEKVAARVAELERRYPGFRELGQEWDQYYKNIREVYGVEEGLISRELADILEKQNPNYAPMRRQFSMEEKFRTGFGQKNMFSGQKAPIKEVSPTGSARKIVDPVRSTIEQTGAWVQAAMRNRVMRIIVDEILKDPDAMKGVAEIVQPPKGSPNLRELVEKEGAEGFLENLAEDFNKLFQRQRVDKDNIVRAMVNGQPVYVKVHDPEAVKALLGMGADNANVAIRIAQAFSNAIKRGATGALAPMFAVKSVTMDTMQALIQSKNPLQHAGYLMGSIISSIADALNIPVLRNMAQDFYRAGGGYSAALRGERGLRKGVESMRLDPLLSGRTIAKGIGKTIAAPYNLAHKIADISENINRIAAFHHRLRQLGGERTPENIREAMNYAREITINYSRRGRWGQGLESLIPYNNAAIQGMYRFAKAWKQNPVKTAAMVGVGVLLPKFYEYMQFHDDPDYQALPAREKYRNLIISKNPDGTFIKIPLSPEYNALGALMVDMLEAYKDGDPDAFKGASDALANAYTPPLVSGALQGFTQGEGIDQSLAGAASATIFAPLTSVMANQSFTGAPIEPMRVQDRSPQYRYDERTSAVAKWLGDKLNWSPMKIDYVIRQYGGDPARILLPVTSEVGAGRPRETMLRNWIVDPVFTNNLANDYYRGKELLSQAYRDNQEMGAPLPKWWSEDLHKLVTSQAKGSISKQLSLLQEQKRQVSVDKSLTSEQRAEKLRDIQRQMNEIYLDVNAKMSEAGVPLPRR